MRSRTTIGWGAVPLAGLLAGCGALGEPATADHVEELMREDAVEDGYDVSFVHAEPLEEEGSFRTVVDREKPDEEGSDETQLCNVNATTMSNSWTCQTMTPSLIAQAVAMLEENYQGRDIELLDYEIDRTGEGLDFAGEIMIREPQSGERAILPCTGSQEGTRFDLNCQQRDARFLPAESAPAESPVTKG